MRKEDYEMMKPLHKLLVWRHEPKAITTGGIHIPETAQEQPNAVGLVRLPSAYEETKAIPAEWLEDLPVGKALMTTRYGAEDLEYGFQLLPAESVLARLTTGGQVFPVWDRVLVALMPNEKTSEGGVLLPENARQPEEFGIVMMAGPRAKILKVGDYVHVPKNAGTYFRQAGESFVILPEGKLLAKVEKGVA